MAYHWVVSRACLPKMASSPNASQACRAKRCASRLERTASLFSHLGESPYPAHLCPRPSSGLTGHRPSDQKSVGPLNASPRKPRILRGLRRADVQVKEVPTGARGVRCLWIKASDRVYDGRRTADY